MTKRAFIIHGWTGHPDEHWLPWLAQELLSRGFEVQTPEMPDTENPNRDRWVSELTRLVGTADKETYLVGHSIGCSAILRYLEKTSGPIGGTVLVAPWVTLNQKSYEDPTDMEIARSWAKGGFDWTAIKKACPHFVALFSEDDPDVPFGENEPIFRNALEAKVIVENGKGHFTAGDGVTELPSALHAVLEMAG